MTLRLHGLTFEEWATDLFEYEYCSDCGGDTKDHLPGVMLGNWFAICAPVSVLTETAEQVAGPFVSVQQAEDWIMEREKVEPDAIHAGKYGINAPEGWE